MATYASTLVQLGRSPPGTSNLLRVLTFLDPESISIDMLKDGCRMTPTAEAADENRKSVQELMSSTINLSRALQYLQRLSLLVLQRDGEIRTLRLHDLVQLVLHTKLMSDAKERKRWLTHTIGILCRAFEKIEDPRSPSYWDQCEVFVAHMRALQRYGDKYEVDSVELWETCSWIASYFAARGRHEEAMMVDEQILARRKIHLGAEHPSTLTSMANLASTYWNQGRWAEAETLDVQVMDTTKRVLGEEHPDTLSSMANLASTYRNQGRWTEAETLEVQVMDTRKRVLGAEHPDTLTSMANLAYTYRSLGRNSDALCLMQDAARKLAQRLGPGHPNAITARETLDQWLSVHDGEETHG
jgi:tetratricopeptide (TPR) repeat protein